MRIPILPILLLLLLLHIPQTHSQQPCNLSLNRLIRAKSYVYACNCPQPDGQLGPVGRAEQSIPSNPPDTAAQASATIRCILSEEARLLSICTSNPRQFDQQATETLSRCVEAPLTPEDQQLEGAFSFNTDNCNAGLATLFGSRLAAVWLCQCFQPRFDVVVGRAEFSTNGSPLGPEQELRFFETCSADFAQELNRICTESPADFEISALQALQVCCRRARSAFDREKFDCDRIVPDDITPFKLPV